MLNVLTYWWTDPNFVNSYTPDDVRKLQRGVADRLSIPHAFVCITDQPEAFNNDFDIRAIAMDRSIHVPGTCFAKLMTFHPNMVNWVGERVFQMDLDTLVVRDFDDVVNRVEDLVLWRNPSRLPWDNPTKPSRCYYNTSFVLHRCGTRPELYTEFDPENPRFRDDQWWVSARLGPDMPYWDGSHGVYRIARPGEPGTGIWGDLPENAKLVTTPGSEGKPSNPVVREANPWLEGMA